ncbi:helix-turn-helix domain-containing protein [Shimia sp. SDUM112013]|uniref:helix-turn-helix transcriptional regulator n=1 Tax=Shimia sp. SDUM112013 TaxID=3136160 RepID=UPI0032F0988D
MTGSIPLIRSGAIAPMRRWLRKAGRDETPCLRQAGLEWVPEDDPTVPIPLLGAIELLTTMSGAFGPDTPYRIVGDVGAFEIGLIGVEGLQGPTVRDGMRRISQMMRFHATHELFSVTEEDDGAIQIVDGWSMNLWDAAAIHYVQQYDVALIDGICQAATGRRPNPSQVWMLPHPEHGLAHLEGRMGRQLAEAKNRALTLRIDAEVADYSIPPDVSRAARRLLPDNPVILPRGATLAEDVATLLVSMLPHTKVTLPGVAAAAGMSARTFRRRLADDGTGFFEIVEQVRAERATVRLSDPNPPSLGALAKELGFRDQATLTRAMHRWRAGAGS